MNEHRPAPPHGAPGQPQHPQHPQQHAQHAVHGTAAGQAHAPGLQRPPQVPHAPPGQTQHRPVPAMVQQPRVAPGVPPARPIEDWDPHRDSIALDDEEPAPAVGNIVPSSKIKVQGLGLSSGIGAGPATQFKRKTHASGTGACRVRSFHGRLSDEGLAFMDGKINEWLDAHPEIEIKTVTTTVGMYDGKIKEEALVVNIWY